MGFIDNAWSGLQLMLEPGNQIIQGTGSTMDYIWMRQDGRPSGLLAMRSPLPIIWNNLYISWNLAFCSNQYSDWPFVFAKLLNPAVLGTYNEVDPGEFVYTVATQYFIPEPSAKCSFSLPPFKLTTRYVRCTTINCTLYACGLHGPAALSLKGNCGRSLEE